MNCLILSDTFPNRAEPSRGPYNAQQIRELARLCRVTVINPIPWPRVCRQTSLRRAVREGGSGLVNGVEVVHPVHWYPPVVGRMAYGRTLTHCVGSAWKRLGRPTFDVIYATWAHPHGYAAMRLARELGAPFVVKVRGTDINVLSSDKGRRRRTAKVMQIADAVIAVSRPLAGEVVRLGAASERVHVLHNGVDKRLFAPCDRAEARNQLGIAAEDKWIVFVGNLLPVKGPDVLLRALAGMDPPRPRAAFVGEGSLRSVLEGMAKELSLTREALFAGACKHDDVALWLNAADVVCIPSRNEGCPNVLLEALACGTPVVASSVGAVPDILHAEGGVLIEKERPSALADALEDVLGRRWSPEAVRESLGPMDWTNNAKKVYKILADVVGRRSRQSEPEALT